MSNWYDLLNIEQLRHLLAATKARLEAMSKDDPRRPEMLERYAQVQARVEAYELGI